MSLILPPPFEYLTQEERQALENAFIDAGVVYDRTTRIRLLDGVNRRYVVYHLPDDAGNSADQLWQDLMRMNTVERLADGSVPLAQWLRNAARRFNVLSQRTLFEAVLKKVTGTGEATTIALEPADAPMTDFEEIVTDGVDDLQDVSFLSVGALRLSAVAKILVPRYENGEMVLLPNKSPNYGAGTGWLIGSDLLITNYHVVRNRLQMEPAPSDGDVLLQALNARAHFFYDADEQEGTKVGIKEMIAVGKERTKDFALLRLASSPNVPCLPVWDDEVKMPEPEKTPKGNLIKALAVNIIQHPGGGPKRVALRNNLVYSAEYPRLHYFTDTLGGSSGSPVFDDTWRVVALHRAAVQASTEFQGRLLGYVNEGIQIHAILAALSELAKGDSRVASALTEIRKDQDTYR